MEEKMAIREQILHRIVTGLHCKGVAVNGTR